MICFFLMLIKTQPPTPTPPTELAGSTELDSEKRALKAESCHNSLGDLQDLTSRRKNFSQRSDNHMCRENPLSCSKWRPGLEASCSGLGGARTMVGSPGDSVGKEYACNAGDLGSNPGLGRSPGEGKRKGYSLQYSGLENFMDLYSPWCCKESDTTEWLSLTHMQVMEGGNTHDNGNYPLT